MFLPIKIVSASSSASAGFFVPGGLEDLTSTNERIFTQAISTIRIGRIFKTTAPGRLDKTREYLKTLQRDWGTILDIGASDGSASAGFIRDLQCDSYMLADKHLTLALRKKGRRTALYDDTGQLHMVQWRRLLCYADPYRVWSSPLERLMSLILRITDIRTDAAEPVLCINPAIRRDFTHVVAVEHDITQRWEGKKAGLVVIANLFNKFHANPAFMRSAMASVIAAMEENALLVVAENTDHERATIYIKNKVLIPLEKINGGSLSEPYVNAAL